MRIWHYIASFAAFLCALSACTGYKPDSDAKTVVVLHSYSSKGEEGKLFSSLMEEEFAKKGQHPNIVHIYTDMVYRTRKGFEEDYWMKGLRDSVKKLQPAVFLVNDDPAFDWVMESKDPMFETTPVVFAGVSSLDRSIVFARGNVTGFEEKIDFAENFKLMRNVIRDFGDNELYNCPIVMLDNTPHDNILRAQMNDAISDTTAFVRNFGPKPCGVSRSLAISPKYHDRIIVSIFSMYQPEGGSVTNDNMLVKAGKSWSTQVKFDLTSNFFSDNTNEPQFTMIREQFNDGTPNPRFLCGCFTGTDIQVRDQVNYAVRLMAGESIRTMPILRHQERNYMDYNAMVKSRLNLKYNQMSKLFTMENAPMFLRYSNIFTAGIISGSMLFLVFIIWLVRKFNKRPADRFKDYDILVHARNLMLDADFVSWWALCGGIISFSPSLVKKFGISTNSIPLQNFLDECIHPDSKPQIEEIREKMKTNGKYCTTLCVTFDGGQTHHYWDVHYDGRSSKGSGDHYGLLTPADEAINAEQELTQAVSRSSETLLKENFLANISHDIRTPLGAVTGFARLLAEPNVSQEDAVLYAGIIKDNSENLLKLIDDVFTKSEEGDDTQLSINLEKRRISDLVYNCYVSNKILVPEGINLLYLPSQGDIRVNVDPLRITQVINNLMSNAIKFTSRGYIKLGWIRVNNNVEVFVADSGTGIAPDKIDTLFTRFAKEAETSSGSGLGLNISQQIIRKHGGEIQVKSVLGQGSRFSFTLPIL